VIKHNASHPARSPEFLSRLYDGELSPAESAHFESHRAHCAECRNAAAEFEAAISLYRSTRTSAAAPDLAARVLSRLQASSRRRSPFGVMFGIDLRWAGGFVAAMVAVILGYAVLERDRPAATIPAKLVTPEPEEVRPVAALDAPPPLTRPAAPERRAPRETAKSETVFAQKELQRVEAVSPPSARDEAGAAPEAPQPKSRDAAPPPGRRPNAAAGSVMRKEKAEVEPAGRALAELDEAAVAVRVRVVTALDGEGTPPDLVNAEEVPLSPADRGEYVVVVNPQGTVLELDRSDSSQERKRQADPSFAPSPGGENLRKLRFALADRPRRLLLRVE
jgi:hypothetical protein